MQRNIKTYQPYDKIFRKLLSDETQIAGLINQYFNLEINITEENLERYHCKFINNQFENRESDIIYKIKSSNIFFLIEHQSKIDYRMSQRIAEYQIEIIKLEKKQKRNNKNLIVPLIIPLVLYTNNKIKWKAHQNILQLQPKIKGYKNLGLGAYNVLDINKFSVNTLLHNKLFTLRILGLEKAKNEKELADIFQYILYMEKDEQNIELLKQIAEYVYCTVTKNNKVKKKLKENLGDDAKMSFIDMLEEREKILINQGKREGKREGKKEGIEKSIKSIVAEMLKCNTDDKFIMQVTKIDAKTLKKLKAQTTKN